MLCPLTSYLYVLLVLRLCNQKLRGQLIQFFVHQINILCLIRFKNMFGSF